MRASQWFTATLKETPKDAEIVSHQLMIRAGLIRKLGAGLYSWLPLGLKVLRKIEAIVRTEMNAAGALEVLMPAIQPAELWQETMRWDTFGDLLLKMTDSNERHYCFGPTHEEVITDLIRNELRSYKQLPVNFYQIQTKFRDEIRPRFGVMRAREFIMKDAYSFHLDEASLQKTYDLMYATYTAVLTKIGLTFRAVEADTGAIGGLASHEFQVLAESGEDTIFYSTASDYAANIEQATSIQPVRCNRSKPKTRSVVDTPNLKTISEVAAHLNCAANTLVKTLIVAGKHHPLVALVIRGDDELNEVKACKHPLVLAPLTFIDEATILKSLHAPVGSLGPFHLPIPIIADFHALALNNFCCGANEADKHFINVNWDNDGIQAEGFDLRNVKVGDLSPDGKGTLACCRGIEVGHVFQLGNKYAQAMKAQVINEHGELQTMLMGCYGLGVSRLVAAAIEQNYDEKGIVWPMAIAPFTVVIIPVNGKRCSRVMDTTETLYQQLLKKGIDVLIDDRDERPGILFADNELIGIAHRIVVGDRNLQNNHVEYKARQASESELIALEDAVAFIESVCS